MSPRELVLDRVKSMPEDISMDEIVAELAYCAAIDEALAQADRGDVISIEEAHRRIKEWNAVSLAGDSSTPRSHGS